MQNQLNHKVQSDVESQKMIKRLNYKEKGITLVALVVTIIVLLILAGITINLVLGNNGVMNRAQYASIHGQTQQQMKKQQWDNLQMMWIV